MPFNDSSSALVAVMISNPYADAGNVGPEIRGRSGAPLYEDSAALSGIMALRSIASPVER